MSRPEDVPRQHDLPSVRTPVLSTIRVRARAPFGRSEGRLGWLMAGPAILMLVTFLAVPFVLAFVLSLTNQRLVSPNPTEFVGSDNFARLLTVRLLTLDPLVDEASGEPMRDDAGQLVYPGVREFTRDNPAYPELDRLQSFMTFGLGDRLVHVLVGDAVFIRSLVNTIVFTAVIVPVQGGLALLLALLINSRARGTNVFRAIYFVPVVMSMVVISLLWRFIYSPQGGLLNGIIGTLTLGAVKPVDWLGDVGTALPAVMLMSMWQAVGFQMVIWLAGLQTIPSHLYEAAALDGAGRWAEFKHVTWPGLRNTAVFVFITITIAAFGLFTQIDVMTRGGPLDATSTVIFQAVEQGFRKQDIAYGSAISVVFFVLVLVVALVQRYLTRERR
jgi:multiple sugar transport system permease protein